LVDVDRNAGTVSTAGEAKKQERLAGGASNDDFKRGQRLVVDDAKPIQQVES